MPNKNRELIEKYLMEIDDLYCKQNACAVKRIEALRKRTDCMIEGDYAGVTAWDIVKQDCNDIRMLLTEQIKDLYKECIRLKAMGEA